MIVVKALHHALFVPNATVLITASKFEQARKIILDIKDMCRRSDFNIKDLEDTDNKTMISIRNHDGKGTSRIVAVAPTESGLSHAATLVLWDETGFTEDSIRLYQQVFLPRTYATKNIKNDNFTMGQIVCISNPNGQQGLLWWQYNNENYSKYRFNFLANEENTIEEYEQAMKDLPSSVFDSTMAATFSSDEGSFISRSEYNLAVSKSRGFIIPSNTPLGIGLDLAGEDVVGRKLDKNTMYIGYSETGPDGKDNTIICYRKSWNSGTPRRLIAAEIIRIWETNHVTKICYDKPGVGDSFKNLLIELKIPEYVIESLTYSLPQKSEVYYNLKNYYEHGRLAHPDILELQSQLSTLDFSRTESGHLKIHHAKEHMHDDEPDALANCVWACTRNQSPAVTLTII